MESRFQLQRVNYHIIALMVLVMICVYSADTFADANKRLTLNTTLKPPLSTPDKQGFVDQLTSIAFSRIGLKLEAIEFPAQRALLDANAGIIDGEIARVAGIEKFYKNLLIVPEKLLDVEFTVFSLKYSEIEPGWNGFSGKSVGFLNGWKILERNIPSSAEITKVNSPKQLFQLLKLDRVDYIVYEKWGGIALANDMKIGKIKVLSPPLAIRPLHIFLHKKHEEHIQSLSSALKQLKSNGTYQNLYNNKLAPYSITP